MLVLVLEDGGLPGCGCAAATVPACGEEAGPGPVGAGSAKQPRELLLVVTKQLLLDVVFKNVRVLSSEMPFFFFFLIREEKELQSLTQ